MTSNNRTTFKTSTTHRQCWREPETRTVPGALAAFSHRWISADPQVQVSAPLLQLSLVPQQSLGHMLEYRIWYLQKTSIGAIQDSKHGKLDLWWWTIDRYDSAGQVHLVSLWPWPLTSKSNQFVFVPNCTKAVNLVKFPRLVHKILCSQTLVYDPGRM